VALISTVAVGTDGSATAGDAVRAAIELAERFEARLVLISAYRKAPDTGVQEMLERTEGDLRGRGLDCSTMVAEGDPAEVLVRLAAECQADVLVVGNKGMRRRVLGSVPNTVSHKAPCSVFIVKTAD